MHDAASRGKAALLTRGCFTYGKAALLTRALLTRNIDA
jgi:hypothetical protein